MLLAVDIGNTNISFAVFRKAKIIRRFNIPTKECNIKKLKSRLGKDKLKRCLICSVVPAAARTLGRNLSRLLSLRPLYIGKDVLVPIKNRYRKPAQVGQDRLVNAYAAVMFYGAPSILIDFGTAITFDVISKNKEYLGGLIIPGLSISLDALAQRTALLPKVKLRAPREFIGRDTANSMLSGIIYGFSALTDDLVRRVRQYIGKGAKVIATGGNIGLIGKYCKNIDRIDRLLTLKGIYLINKNCSPT